MKFLRFWINYIYSIIASFTIDKGEVGLLRQRSLYWLMAFSFGGVLNLCIYPFIRDAVFSIFFGLLGGFILGFLWMILEGFTFNPKVYQLDKGVRMRYFLLIIISIFALFIVPIFLISH